MYDGARVPSPPDSTNGLPHLGASTSRPQPEEAVHNSETVLVKKAHREILDHERKRRVELKCMELQEMMEEEGYSEEEIKQKVGTFRHMLMEKEGVITRVESCQPPVVTRDSQDTEGNRECTLPAEPAIAQCGCHFELCETNSVLHSNYSPPSQMKRKSSCSSSPPPKKRKKKKHRRWFKSCSPPHAERKRRSGKKRKRCRSLSGSRKKRRYRSGSPKNANQTKYKQKKKGSHHRETSCSSRSESADGSSPPHSRPVTKHRVDGHKPSFSSSDSNRSPSTSLSKSQSPSRIANPTKAWQNGHQDGGTSSRESDLDQARGHKSQDNEPIAVCLYPRASLSPQLKGSEGAARLPVPTGEAARGDERVRSPSAYLGKSRGQRGTPERRSHSPANSSDSLPSHLSQEHRKKDTRHKKVKGSHSSRRRHRRRAHARRHSSSRSPAWHSRQADGGRKCPSHGTRQRSSPRSCSRSTSRERQSQTESPHSRQNSAREKDSDGRTSHTDTESRARHRSRSYSPIRKRRSDSPSFMEARRITSARKRPIPYYRPSPSSTSSMSSCSPVRRRSRSRSWSSRSPSRNHSYYSRGSSQSLT